MGGACQPDSNPKDMAIRIVKAFTDDVLARGSLTTAMIVALEIKIADAIRQAAGEPTEGS